MTQEFLQDAMVADLKELFSHERLKNSLGVEREIQIYPQDVPIRRGDDEAIDKEAPPEPYVVVRLRGGKTETMIRRSSTRFWWPVSMTRIRGAKATGTPCTSSTKFTITIPLAP